SGYAPEQGESDVYFSGFSVAEHKVLLPPLNPFGPNRRSAVAGKRLMILTNAGTRTLTGVVAALQTSGQAVVLHDSSDPSDFAASETYAMQLAEGIVAKVRTTDLVNADGTVGFLPDVIGAAANAEGEDVLMNKAIAIAREEEKPPERPAARPATNPVRQGESWSFSRAAPSREYRLLGLFRAWNVVHYFFPYKHLMDRSWDSVLTEFTPRFAEAESPSDYGFAVREMLAYLQDSHVNAKG